MQVLEDALQPRTPLAPLPFTIQYKILLGGERDKEIKVSCPETQDKHLAMSQNSNLLTHSPPNKHLPQKIIIQQSWHLLPFWERLGFVSQLFVCFFNFKDAVSIFILFQSYLSTVKSLLKGCSHEQVILTCTRLQNMPCTCLRHLRIILAPNS